MIATPLLLAAFLHARRHRLSERRFLVRDDEALVSLYLFRLDMASCFSPGLRKTFSGSSAYFFSEHCSLDLVSDFFGVVDAQNAIQMYG